MAQPLETAYVELTTKGKQRVKRDCEDVSRAFKRTGGFASSAAKKVAALFAGAAVLRGMKSMIDAMEKQEVAERKLEAVLKATGQAAGFSALELKKYASELQRTTRFGDETIISAQALLATFTQIQGPIFKQAIAMATSMSTIFGQDLTASVVQLGKALNDPIRGVNALRRAGVSFNAQQLEQIRVLQQSGDLMGAQKVILDELKAEFGGMAEAAATTFGGALDQAKNSFGDLMETIGTGVERPLTQLVKAWKEASEALNEYIQLSRTTDEIRVSGQRPENLSREQLVAQGDVEALSARLAMVRSTIAEEEEARRSGGFAAIESYRNQTLERAYAQERELKDALFLARANRASGNVQRDPRAVQEEKNAARRAEQEGEQAREAQEYTANLRRLADQENMRERGDQYGLERQRIQEERQKALAEAAAAGRDTPENIAQIERRFANMMSAAYRAEQERIATREQQAEDERLAALDAQVRHEREAMEAAAEEDERIAAEARRQAEEALAPEQRSSRMALVALEQQLQEAALRKEAEKLDEKKVKLLEQQLRALDKIDANTQDINEFGAGAIA